MPSSVSPLFSPFSLNRLTLPNRIVMAPMTRNQSPGGVPGDDVVGYYRRRAERSVGLIITEGTVIEHPASAGSPRVPRFYGDDALAGWARVSAAVHAAGGRIIPQLWHVGAARKPGSEPNPGAPPIGPSGLDLTGAKVAEPPSEAEVTGVVVRTPDELGRFLIPLVDAGVDAFHCSTRRFWAPEFEGSNLNLAGWTKRLTAKPTITVGSIGLDDEFVGSVREGKSASNVGVEAAIAMIERGEVDLVAVGRALLVDPGWVEKIRDGQFADLRPFAPEALKTLS
jgi:2,4-dienoyl-CoA reductase-like NADH-dependent reductase (Old Yellow Enzyme family)